MTDNNNSSTTTGRPPNHHHHDGTTTLVRRHDDDPDDENHNNDDDDDDYEEDDDELDDSYRRRDDVGATLGAKTAVSLSSSFSLSSQSSLKSVTSFSSNNNNNINVGGSSSTTTTLNTTTTATTDTTAFGPLQSVVLLLRNYQGCGLAERVVDHFNWLQSPLSSLIPLVSPKEEDETATPNRSSSSSSRSSSSRSSSSTTMLVRPTHRTSSLSSIPEVSTEQSGAGGDEGRRPVVVDHTHDTLHTPVEPLVTPPRTTNTKKINGVPVRPQLQRKLRGVESSGFKWTAFELANELGIEGALLGYLAMGLAGISLLLLLFLLLDYIRTRMKIHTSVRKNR